MPGGFFLHVHIRRGIVHRRGDVRDSDVVRGASVNVDLVITRACGVNKY